MLLLVVRSCYTNVVIHQTKRRSPSVEWAASVLVANSQMNVGGTLHVVALLLSTHVSRFSLILSSDPNVFTVLGIRFPGWKVQLIPDLVRGLAQKLPNSLESALRKITENRRRQLEASLDVCSAASHSLRLNHEGLPTPSGQNTLFRSTKLFELQRLQFCRCLGWSRA